VPLIDDPHASVVSDCTEAKLTGMDGSKTLRVAALLNETAGTLKRQSPDTFPEALTAAFARRGVSADLEFLPSSQLGHAAERARDRAAKGEIDAVVVGGGDGTIRTVAGVLAGTDIPLGVLPLGTLNHFAKDLGLPLDLDGAVDVICAAYAQRVDVAEVNGQVFVNNSSIGIYPYMVLDRERRRSNHGQAKWIATFLAVLRTLRYLPRRRLSIRAEGWAEPCRTPCLFVGNNAYSLVGSSLGKRERLDQGEMCLYIARQGSRTALVLLALKSALGLINEAHDLRTLKVNSAEIQSRTSRLLVAMDGEVSIQRPPLHYRVRRGALRVFVPPAAEA
jgi:diacylglycerol kinase family enzyme